MTWSEIPLSLIDDNTHVVVLTDLESDDELAVRIGFKGLAEKQLHPDVSFVVGEGYSPIQRQAKLKALIKAEGDLHKRPDFADFPVGMGSSSMRRIGLTHAIFNATSFGANAHVAITNREVTERIVAAKKRGKRIVIMELKPVNDSYEILRRCGHLLTEDDFVLFSGSYNFREADVTFGQLEQLLNRGGRYQRVLFESWPSLRRGGFPGELSTRLDQTPIGRNIGTLRAQMLADTSVPSLSHERTVGNWNIAVSADCIYSVAEIMWDSGIGDRSIVREVGESIIASYLTSSKLVDELNSTYMSRLANAVLGPSSVDSFAHRSAELLNRLQDSLVKTQFETFKRNWNVADAIRHDRNEMLIGDAIPFAYAFNTSLMRTEAGTIDFANPSRYSNFTPLKDDEGDTGFRMMTGVNKPFELIRALSPVVGLELPSGMTGLSL